MTGVRLLVTTGGGPSECRMAAGHVLTRMAEEAQAAGVTEHVTGDDDPASALVTMSGAGAEGLADAWTGTVQWTVQSPLRPNHRRRNWVVGVIALGAAAASPTVLEDRDLRFDAFRAGGPGGQHQNKTDSAVRVTHIPTGLSAMSKDDRSQHRNKRIARDRLADRMLLIHMEKDAAARADAHRLHGALARGGPARRFKGKRFEEV